MFQNQDVHTTVIVIVAESCAAARKSSADSSSHLRRNIFESAVAEVLVHKPRILESLAKVVLVDLRIDMPVHLYDVAPSVIVIVDKPQPHAT